MAVDRSCRTPDRQWLVDQVVDEPGVAYRMWDAEGAPIAEVGGPDEPGRLLGGPGVDPQDLMQVPTEDP